MSKFRVMTRVIQMRVYLRLLWLDKNRAINEIKKMTVYL